MRTIWRLCSARFAATALGGHGARLYGGRWNAKGTAMVYCSSSLALAALETLVHSTIIPSNHVAIRIELPASVHIERWRPSALPRNWRTAPAPVALARRGSVWVRSGRSVALEVPSAIVPHETNVLLNPTHRDFAKLIIHRAERFVFDPRLK
jgi:RES domain-containing protein